MSGDYLEKIDLVSDLLFNGVFLGEFSINFLITHSMKITL